MSRPGPVLLEVTDLRVAYGKAHVVHGASLTVREGEFVVVLGRNGAGKSTILHALSGLIGKQGGRVTFAGADITRASPRDIVRAGLVQVLEGHRVFTSLSVEDNLLVGTYAGRGGAQAAGLERIYADFPELAEKRHQQASRLSGGQQQILAVAQGLIADPRLLILDEPSGGLAPLVVDRILDVASRLSAAGTAVLLVEQLVEKALRHATYGYLLETGAVAGEGTAAELQDSALLRRIYLGGAEAA
ncbi:High-affinity branched-chain amino acid transport ATP-binding protein LivF [Methylobacterium crusticola]|uniref:High-affinity branched-chain amino acid transport ATP-binding protein LivF n=1 Tax=Methylobacterium crusticola TaxID=1697972 RepID=A0ABQ4R074_9HYPH|nr:ABC transporter ATP-binding protein [Methylobacterium crusticola]GJD50559.1 High-affinity branched-chain amino acid transport ATP-binding protein LivF [Methylobacterium crusticola]